MAAAPTPRRLLAPQIRALVAGVQAPLEAKGATKAPRGTPRQDADRFAAATEPLRGALEAVARKNVGAAHAPDVVQSVLKAAWQSGTLDLSRPWAYLKYATRCEAWDMADKLRRSGFDWR